MASLNVFADMMSQPSRSVILLLKANKIPFTTTIIDITKGDLLDRDCNLYSTLYSMSLLELRNKQSHASFSHCLIFSANAGLSSPFPLHQVH